MDTLRRRIPFKVVENHNGDDDDSIIYDEQRVSLYNLLVTFDEFVPEQEFVIQELRQELDSFNRKALFSLKVLVGLSCIMYVLFYLPLRRRPVNCSQSFPFLVNSCSTIFKIIHLLQSSLPKNPSFPSLCVSYLACLHFSYTTSSRSFFQASFAVISTHIVTLRQYPIKSSTQSPCWPRPYLSVLKYHGRLPFGGHIRLF